MLTQVSRILQLLITIAVTAGVMFIELVSYGPDIDGRTPPLADTIQGVALESTIVLAFGLSAIALFRWQDLGWWLSVVLDGFLGLAAGSMIVGDLATQAGREAFYGDLAIHGAILLLCIGATGFLLSSRKQFLTTKSV